MKIDLEAIPEHFETCHTQYGTFVLCPICKQPCVQTSPEFLACEHWEHTGLVRHAGSVTESWSLLNLWRLCESLPKATLLKQSRWSLDLSGPAGRLQYRWVPGTLRCINGQWTPPKEPDYPLPPSNAVLAVCKFRGQIGPRYFVPIPKTKGLDHVESTLPGSAKSGRKARRVRKPRAQRGEVSVDAGSRW